MMSGIVMVASFVVCWMPYYSYGVLYLIKPAFAITLPKWLPMFLHAFGHLHACVNPLIYGYQAIKMFTLRKVLQQTAIRKRHLKQVLAPLFPRILLIFRSAHSGKLSRRANILSLVE